MCRCLDSSSSRGVIEKDRKILEMARLRVKICCIASEEEARLAVGYGADALGLVSEMPSGPGVIDENAIATIAAGVPEGTETFLLTSRTQPTDIADQFKRCGTTTIQLCDWLGRRRLEELRKLCPSARLVQVIHVLKADDIQRAVGISGFVDAVLLDSGRPNADQPELGGTGRTHDWSISRAIREAVPVPLYLAGGLNAGNVVSAVEAVEPFGIDLCSGVRTDDKLDEQKLAAFIRVLAPSAEASA